ncbi:Proteasome subunit beta type [Fasciolopsis buskii]|uniref:proteasome endopeptidase complex n=1 Tax=Fasciolopsis buskii TaxID=27845 RepID=A0A8E0VGJ8_9TREM|nr:Proteasome subunit beta type [Fasciolopsis buski]
MSAGLLEDRGLGGFSFENCSRNAILEKSGLTLPKAIKTGTTICGVVFKDGVVLGSDTRATEGNIVAEKNCRKIHYISERIYCCGAGTAADTEMTTLMISSKVELHRLNTGRQPRVILPLRLLKDYLFGYRVGFCSRFLYGARVMLELH